MKTTAKTSKTSEGISQLIAKKLLKNKKDLQKDFNTSEPFRCCYIDDLLPEHLVQGIGKKLPPLDSMLLRSTLRERKRVQVQFQKDDLVFTELLQAFQAPEVLHAVEEITGLAPLLSDPTLYASGLSVMGKGDFLNPHLDNSHDGDQKNYRAINILYYLSEDWPANESSGGNLELWSEDFKQHETIPAVFNRLAIMETHDTSWHSVSPIQIDGLRICISNYYFTEASPHPYPYRHVTTFRGRPEQTFRGLFLRADGALRNFIGRAFPATLKKTKHRLKK